MGRQVYLTRFAFGRSAFEPCDVEEVPFPLAGQLSSNAGGHQTADYNSVAVTQAYDARGHPNDVHSQHLGRQLRDAANRVLVAIRAVERNNRNQSYLLSESHPPLGTKINSEENAVGWSMWVASQIDALLYAFSRATGTVR